MTANYPRPDRRWTGPDIEAIARKRLQRHEAVRTEIAHDLATEGTNIPDYKRALTEGPTRTNMGKPDDGRRPIAGPPAPVPDYQARGKRPVIADRLYPLVLLCNAHGLPEPMPEYQFDVRRGWRADYCWVQQKIICEIDGGVWTGGRHVRGQGFIEDQRKLNAAAVLGFRVLRYTPDRLGEAIEDLRKLLT